METLSAKEQLFQMIIEADEAELARIMKKLAQFMAMEAANERS